MLNLEKGEVLARECRKYYAKSLIFLLDYRSSKKVKKFPVSAAVEWCPQIDIFFLTFRGETKCRQTLFREISIVIF